MAIKSEELRKLSIEELAQKNKETRDQLFNAKVRQATGQLEDTAQIRTLRRDVARVETVLRQKQNEVNA